MDDMAATIIPKSDQINADDLIVGPRTITVSGVSVRPGAEQPVSISIDGDQKVFRPCKSMCRVMVTAWGADSSKYVGRRMVLYCDPKVKWGGMEVGGIRIGAMSDIEAPMTLMLSETKTSRKPYSVKTLPAPVAVADTAQRIMAEMTGADSLEAFTAIAKRNGSAFKSLPADHRAMIEAHAAECRAALTPSAFDHDPDTGEVAATDRPPEAVPHAAPSADATPAGSEAAGTNWDAWLDGFNVSLSRRATTDACDALWAAERKSSKGMPAAVLKQGLALVEARQHEIRSEAA